MKTIDEIKLEVSKELNVPVEKMYSKSKSPMLVNARVLVYERIIKNGIIPAHDLKQLSEVFNQPRTTIAHLIRRRIKSTLLTEATNTSFDEELSFQGYLMSLLRGRDIYKKNTQIKLIRWDVMIYMKELSDLYLKEYPETTLEDLSNYINDWLERTFTIRDRYGWKNGKINDMAKVNLLWRKDVFIDADGKCFKPPKDPSIEPPEEP